MAKLEILITPDPRLKEVAKPVETVDDALIAQMDDMLETMYDAPGVGLAGPQVGILKRILVLDAAREDEEPQPMYVINPEIYWESDDGNIYEEGCLSVPGQYAKVERPKEVKVRFLDKTGTEQDVHATGFLATVLQHEIDHLNGTLFIDHISGLKRRMLLKRLEKEQKSI